MCEYMCVHVCDLHPEPPTVATHPAVRGVSAEETANQVDWPAGRDD